MDAVLPRVQGAPEVSRLKAPGEIRHPETIAGMEQQLLRLGTSAFTAAGWPGTFYPDGLPERDYLCFYAQKFDTVKIDSTFYRTPYSRD